MKIEKNILIAFILNLLFSLFELIGGILTNSVSILSDSFHDLTDAISIGISYFLEKKSKNKPDLEYTFGYVRYSLLGGVITTSILITGSLLVIYNSILRIINPVTVNYKGMFILALIGVIINLISVFVTKEGNSLNQKSVNLHMLEDSLGWIVVLIGSILMNIFDLSIIDPLMSIGVSLFILIHSIKNLKEILDVFLQKTNINIIELKNKLLKIKGIEDIHHIHVWSMDGYNNYATMHVVTKSNNIKELKDKIKKELKEYNIVHTIIETETEICEEIDCNVEL